MERPRPINFQMRENKGRRGLPAVLSHTAMPRNSPKVYHGRTSPRHRAKFRYSQA